MVQFSLFNEAVVTMKGRRRRRGGGAGSAGQKIDDAERGHAEHGHPDDEAEQVEKEEDGEAAGTAVQEGHARRRSR